MIDLEVNDTNTKQISKKRSRKDGIFTPQISIIGVGGYGINAINSLINMGLKGVKFIATNTDVKSLDNACCPNKIHLGLNLTKGLGAGSNPEVGFKAAEQSKDELAEALEGTDLLFIVAGLGGGTGTGASPVIAKLANELGILTLGFVTKPWEFEGEERSRVADAGLVELERNIDSVIVMANQNIFKVIDERTSAIDALRVPDAVIYSAIKAISDLISANGIVNLDFNDIRHIISHGGKALVSSVEVAGEGEDTIEKITESVLNNPLIEEDINKMNVQNILISITGGSNMTLFAVDRIINSLRHKARSNTYINFGAVFDDSMGDKIRISVIATGINELSDEEDFVSSKHINFSSPDHDDYANEEEPEEHSSFVTTPQRGNKWHNKLNSAMVDNQKSVKASKSIKSDNTHASIEDHPEGVVRKTRAGKSLFNLIEERNKSDDLPILDKIDLETNKDLSRSTKQNEDPKTEEASLKSFFELPTFLRKK